MSATANPSGSAPMAPAAVEALLCVAHHRLLSTEQVRLLRGPQASLRWTRELLAELERRRLLAHVLAGRRRKLWHVTRRGALSAAATGALARRPKLLSREQASGALQAHTLAVNDAGIAWLRAARERGDDFSPLSWQHEIAHPLRRTHGRRTLIADALLTYLIPGEDGRPASLEYRLLELDRATLSVDRLAAKLARYAELHRATDERGVPAWRAWYPTFPAVHLVLANTNRQTLERRRNAVLALCHSDPQVERTPQLAISICLAADLERDGPFGPIFLDRDGHAVDWLGAAARARRGRG